MKKPLSSRISSSREAHSGTKRDTPVTANAGEQQDSAKANGAPRLLAEERRRAVLQVVNREGRITISDLTSRFDVSAVTARADLDVLGRAGRVLRSHGGAVRLAEPEFDAPLDVKGSLHHEEKVRIAAAAAGLVRAGQTILLDSGTTSLELARALNQSGMNLTVVTHALNVASELSHSPQITLMMIGGVLRQISQSFVGPQAQNTLSKLHVDHLFLAVDGLDLEVGPCTPDVLEAELNTTMIRIAKQTTVIADASKIGRPSLSVIAPLTSVHRVITDRRIVPEQAAALEAKGLEVIVV
jgi:DeoR family transcriptional regulator, aga operon transcriptional repressor